MAGLHRWLPGDLLQIEQIESERTMDLVRWPARTILHLTMVWKRNGHVATYAVPLYQLCISGRRVEIASQNPVCTVDGNHYGIPATRLPKEVYCWVVCIPFQPSLPLGSQSYTKMVGSYGICEVIDQYVLVSHYW